MQLNLSCMILLHYMIIYDHHIMGLEMGFWVPGFLFSFFINSSRGSVLYLVLLVSFWQTRLLINRKEKTLFWIRYDFTRIFAVKLTLALETDCELATWQAQLVHIKILPIRGYFNIEGFWIEFSKKPFSKISQCWNWPLMIFHVKEWTLHQYLQFFFEILVFGAWRKSLYSVYIFSFCWVMPRKLKFRK